MPLVPNKEPAPSTYANDRRAIWREIEALWRRGQVGDAAAASDGGSSTDVSSNGQVQFAYDYAVVP